MELVTAILVKGMKSDYAMTVGGSDSKPCSSELHHVSQKLSRAHKN